jgi:DNA-binding transcriptional MocR family regulator
MGSKTNKKGRTKGQHSFFVALELFLMATPAWRALSMAARVAYVEIAALYDQSNNGRLALSARQLAGRMPISRATATRAFQELTEKGFITATKPSGFNMKTGERKATEWRLTRYRCDVTGDLPTKAFMAWQPEEKPGEIHFAASPQGHSGFTTEPPKAKNGQKSNVVALSRSRPAISAKHDGFTTGPLLDSTIGDSGRESAAAAHTTQAASARPDNQIILTRALARALNS